MRGGETMEDMNVHVIADRDNIHDSLFDENDKSINSIIDYLEEADKT
jgi:hypothetical protein